MLTQKAGWRISATLDRAAGVPAQGAPTRIESGDNRDQENS